MANYGEKVAEVFTSSTDVDEWDIELSDLLAEAEDMGIHADILEGYTVLLFFIDAVEKKLYLRSIEPNGTIGFIRIVNI